jgi:regulator of RNase E activity RraA
MVYDISKIACGRGAGKNAASHGRTTEDGRTHMVETSPTAQPSPIPSSTFAALRHASTATLTTQLLSRGLRNTLLHGLLPLNRLHGNMVGEASTLRYIPAREDLDVLSAFQDYDHPQRRAIEQVQPGQVLVIDSRGQQRAASLGHILATRLLRGCAGVVTDGSVRDVAGFRTLGLPTFAHDPSANTNLIQHHAVDMQLPIARPRWRKPRSGRSTSRNPFCPKWTPVPGCVGRTRPTTGCARSTGNGPRPIRRRAPRGPMMPRCNH